MKIHIANYEPNRQGGGWSFARNFAKCMDDYIADYNDADIFFITSPSMVTKEQVDQAQADGKKIVLRIDNIVRNSRNRNTGMSRMKRFAQQADLVVYQSDYFKQVLMPFTEKDGVTILNSCDTSIFNAKGRVEDTKAKFIYSRVNRDETKNWEMARFIFQEEYRMREGNAHLDLVGQFSPELAEYNFDFYMNEDYKYWGVVTSPELMATLYRNADYLIYTFWNDACSNTLIEALCCGCVPLDPYGMLETGGASEIMHYWAEHKGEEYFGLARLRADYEKELSKL